MVNPAFAMIDIIEVKKKKAGYNLFEQNQANHEYALLVGCILNRDNEEKFLYSMSELKALTEAAQGNPIEDMVIQKRERFHPATVIGKGKLEEVAAIVEEESIDIVIFNHELSPSQTRNISNILNGITVIDRTQLILDIFAQRARTKEGQLQIELAQYKYLLPRIAGQGTQLSRLGGGIGTRGPGETKLESDRRHIRRRINEIEKQLKSIVSHRERYRTKRKTNQVIQVALVGYTNVGKSTIFNKLTMADSLEENQLFATLDPMTRKMKLPSGLSVVITDTVGFVQDLPTTLVAAFRSTLEEVQEADLILHVIDASNPERDLQEETVYGLLDELNASAIPVIKVYNKSDLVQQKVTSYEDTFLMSARSDDDIEKLSGKIEVALKEMMEFYNVLIPKDGGKLLTELKTNTILLQQKWDDTKNGYECEGYILESLPLYRLLKMYMQ
jgi:GTP-binding protein HflX